jgi:hypothetical protein
MDFDPRDYDSRDEERHNSRGGTGNSHDDFDDTGVRTLVNSLVASSTSTSS